MIAAGADPNRQGGEAWPALSAGGTSRFAYGLGNHGLHPLAWAVMLGSPEIAEVLLAAGADFPPNIDPEQLRRMEQAGASEQQLDFFRQYKPRGEFWFMMVLNACSADDLEDLRSLRDITLVLRDNGYSSEFSRRNMRVQQELYNIKKNCGPEPLRVETLSVLESMLSA